MSEDSEKAEEPKKKSGKMLIIIGAVLFLVSAAGGYFVVGSGLLGGGSKSESEHAADDGAHGSGTHNAPLIEGTGAFVAVEPVVVSLPRGSGHKLLRVAVSLEVDPAAESQVTALMPRVVDVMNSYLRAVEVDMLEDPLALDMVRGHLLARLKVVAGVDAIHDVLIQEFVVS